MGERATPRRPAPPARGILSSRAPDGQNEHRRVLPREALAPFVAHFWSVRWSLREPFVAETLPHPSVHVVIEAGPEGRRAEVAGVHTGRFVKRLHGDGWVFGIKFRPAMFQALLGAPMSSISDRVLPVGAVLGSAGEAWADAILAAADLDTRIDLTEAFLAPRLSPAPPEVVRIRDLVERMAVDRSMLRVEDAAEAADLDVRALQRSFRRHVGASPKWVIRRYRLHEAAEQLNGPSPPSAAALAAALGYADQAHFAREFKLVIGRTPRAFALDARRHQAPLR